MSHARRFTLRFGPWTVALALLVGLLIGLPFASAQSNSFVVIVHPDNPATTMSAKDVSGYFLKKITRWRESRLPVQPVDLVPGAEVREAFSSTIHGRSVDRIKNYWQRRIFSGRDVPPPELATEREVVELVAQQPGGIGYVSAGTSLDGVVAVSVTSE